MERDPIGYLHYLETSTDPAAVSVRRQIASGPADLARAREAAAKEGIPLDAAALQKPLPPDDQNAAPLYQKLFQLLKDKPLHLPMYAQPLGTNYTYTPEQLAAVQKIYDSRPDVWDLVHQAADRPQCVFARDWKQGAGNPVPGIPTDSGSRAAAQHRNVPAGGAGEILGRGQEPGAGLSHRRTRRLRPGPDLLPGRRGL